MSHQNGAIDKDANYGDYRQFAKKKRSLYLRAVSKALDMPEDDMQLNTYKTTGIGWRELLVLGGIVLGGAGLYGWIAKSSADAVAPPSPPAVYGVPSDSEYEVRFYDKDGNLIPVERLPAELRK